MHINDFILQDEFKAAHPHDITPVEINDVVFAIHAAVLTMVTIVQVFIYEVRFVTYYSTVHLPFLSMIFFVLPFLSANLIHLMV